MAKLFSKRKFQTMWYTEENSEMAVVSNNNCRVYHILLA